MAKPAQSASGSGADRLARVAAMVTDAVDLLNQAMEEIKSERGYGDRDDSTTPGAPDGGTEKPG